MRYCRSCGQEILFAKHADTGKVAPLERDPDGLWTVVHDDYFQASPGVPPEHRYTVHFARCPQAADWRRE